MSRNLILGLNTAGLVLNAVMAIKTESPEIFLLNAGCVICSCIVLASMLNSLLREVQQ